MATRRLAGSAHCGATRTSTGSSRCAATRPRSLAAAAAGARLSPARASGRSTSPRQPPSAAAPTAAPGYRAQPRVGDVLTFYLYGRPADVRVARVVATKGLAGVGTGTVARNAFFAPGTLVRAAEAARPAKAGAAATPQPHTFTFVSNTG